MTRPTPPPDLGALPPALDIVTAGRLLGIGRTTAYQLARHNQFPVPVLRIGHGYRVPTAPLLALLGVDALSGAAPQRCGVNVSPAARGGSSLQR